MTLAEPGGPAQGHRPAGTADAATPAADKLTWREKSLYGVGGVVYNLLTNAVFRLANPVLNIGLHIRPELVGFAIFLPRIWGVMSDPIIGRISDNTRSRWGRRRPFMVGGAIAAGLTLGLVFMGPTGGDGMTYFYWFLGFSLLYYTASSVFLVPYAALGNEMSPDYHERTSISGYKAAGTYVGGFINQGLPYFVGLACWGGIAHGARVASWLLMGLVVGVGVAVGLASRERYFQLAHGQERVRLRAAIQDTCRHRSFVALAVATLVYWMGFALVDSLGIYINVYYVAAGSGLRTFEEVRQAGFEYQFCNGITQHVLSLVFLPVIMRFSKRYGKMRAFELGLLLSSCASALKLVCYTPQLWQLQLLVPLLMGPGQSFVFVVSSSLLADLVDEDELQTGWRREGIYGAVLNWLQKVSIGVAVLFSSWMLASTGFQAAQEAAQAPGVILTLRWLYAVAPVLACLAAAVALRRYTLSEGQAREIRDQLQQRRGLITGSGTPASST